MEYLKKYRESNKEIISKKKREYYVKNRNEILEQQKEYAKKNYDKIKEKRQTKKECLKEYLKIYRKKNKETIRKKQNEYQNTKYYNDISYKTEKLIRNRFKHALKSNLKNGKTKLLKEYGINIGLIIEHLGNPPQDGKVYHIDHIFPVSAFDLNDPEHIKLCWHPDNLQWLEASENCEKNDKYDEKEFEKYLTGHVTHFKK